MAPDSFQERFMRDHPTSEARRSLLVSDFDGTFTRNDFYHIVLDRFAPANLAENWQAYKSGRLSHFDALGAIFAAIRTTESAMLAAVRQTAPDPDAKNCIALLADAGWDVVIASAGCEWYIRRVLADCGIDVPVYANPGYFLPEGGLIMEPPTRSPYFHPLTGIDKAAIVREAIAEGRRVAFAGDGYTDEPAARLVPPELRFARADLADVLDRDREPYRPFQRWSEIARALLEI
jgi:2-hydroxy-3-keto-5-methylthiopentenyl-1-phosphate phosphatase